MGAIGEHVACTMALGGHDGGAWCASSGYKIVPIISMVGTLRVPHKLLQTHGSRGVTGILVQGIVCLWLFDTLEVNVGRTGNYKRGDSSLGFVAHIEECVNELDSSQKTLLEMLNGMSGDFRATLDVVRNEVVDVNTRLNFTMRAMANQAPIGGEIPVSKVKFLKPKSFYGARDAKALENFIFDLE
ncbi:uncharacterized protein E5676_scaffold306G002830 [Cucumis melo var. makuwa]|uniref:Senescence-specific cysteine protease sag39 n=1 Tax=Cucumis melo var. makuwa TaxID=1194695 RepID=A0A5D3D255_CUCMM|nr:uncharacterized protein E6C27_scaffold67G004940 [Cucumis melo var. makuwa]TYK17977.1 uncharacterized protein E5676_scaffold306G002830 [Cucumis melo var. makuwa]